MNKYLVFKDKDVRTNINILILVMIFSGIFGFIYETIFYRIDLGYFVKRGSSFGPWIPIYVYGGLIITLILYKLRDKPYLIFIYSTLLSGIIEYTVGYYIEHYMNMRLWNYNTEILNFGNINGYICLRSILFFGISSLFLIYKVIPIIIKICDKYSSNKITIIANLLIIIYFIDIIIYSIIR